MNYIAYYRVSTKMQHLGLDAQRSTVQRFLQSDDILVSEYTEQESGKNDNRIELHKAIDECKATGATLLIAKLDRLSRSVTFISQLMDSGLNFVCCDMVSATPFTLHIFAALAQQERELISTRTKAALAVLKASGVKLGKPENLTDDVRAKGRLAYSVKARTSTSAIQVLDKITDLKAKNLTLQQIADKLNQLGYKTPRGKAFRTGTVDMLLKRISDVRTA